MAVYKIKLVDHTGSDSTITSGIGSALKDYFDRVFADTSHSATVGWGSGSSSDAIVLHFVEDVASSYIVQKMKRPPKISPLVGGHTTLRDGVLCSEFYKTVTIRGKTRTLSGVQYAKLAFHEGLHNAHPLFTEDDLRGHGGLAESPVVPDLNERDIGLMKDGLATRGSKYSQQP
jgi:hypothetical protein